MKSVELQYTIHNLHGDFLQLVYDKNGKQVITWTKEFRLAWKTNSLPMLKYMRNAITTDGTSRW